MQNEIKQHYLAAMGITQWVPKNDSRLDAVANTTVFEAEPPVIQTADWSSLREQVSACQQCGLCKTRTQTVFGVGDVHADLLIVGEAPGAHEDQQGEPFVGRAGKLLDAMMFAIGLSREQIFIANILKCRPPNNRDPSPEEVTTCTPFLQQQMQLLQPKLIMAVGRIAAHFLLDSSESLGRLRGRQLQYEPLGIPLIVTYHPAYLLRSPSAKSKALQDLYQVKATLSAPY